MFRIRNFCLIACALGSTQPSFATSFGYSVNINFGDDGLPMRRGAGVFDDRIWNNFAEAEQGRPMPMMTDNLGRPDQSRALVLWSSPGIQLADNVKPENPEDARLMRSYLDSPSSIVLQNIDQVVPNQRGPVSYSLILYTFGGREGATGRYIVNGRAQDHIDSGEFDGRFTSGIGGNMLIFDNLVGPTLTINTEGFGPINAMSLIYCRPGDIDGNGTIDVDDLDIVNEAVRVGDGNLSYDINLDLVVDFQDVMSWIKCSKGTCVGDVNLDGVFDSGDLVQLFQVGLYESGRTAKWTTGDWNGDFKFDSNDLLVAFQEGCYEMRDAFAIDGSCLAEAAARQFVAIPEPATAGLMGCGSLAWLAFGRRRGRSRSSPT